MANFIEIWAIFKPRVKGSDPKKIEILFFLVQHMYLDTTLAGRRFKNFDETQTLAKGSDFNNRGGTESYEIDKSGKIERPKVIFHYLLYC